jgi:hypothetical protein
MDLLAQHRARIADRCAQLGITLDEDAFIFSLSPDA